MQVSRKKSKVRTVKKVSTKSRRSGKKYKLVDASLEKGLKGPSLDAKYGLQPGNFAKLMFIEKGNPQRERMWVKIEKRGSGGKYMGKLDNKPVVLKNVKLGDKIVFSTRNIIAIMK